MKKTEILSSKSISSLNIQWWYRLIKVFYILFFIVTTVITVFLVFSANSPTKIFDNENSYVKCDDGREFGLDENNIYLTNGYLGTSSFDALMLRKYCAYDSSLRGKAAVDARHKAAETATNLKTNNFKLVPVYELEGSYVKFYEYLLSSIVIILIFFEVFRRIFYYIVLGSFIPKK